MCEKNPVCFCNVPSVNPAHLQGDPIVSSPSYTLSGPLESVTPLIAHTCCFLWWSCFIHFLLRFLPPSPSILSSLPLLVYPLPSSFSFSIWPTLHPSIVASCFMKSDCSNSNIQVQERVRERRRERQTDRKADRQSDRNGGDRKGKWRDNYLVYLLVQKLFFSSLYFPSQHENQ